MVNFKKSWDKRDQLQSFQSLYSNQEYPSSRRYVTWQAFSLKIPTYYVILEPQGQYYANYSSFSYPDPQCDLQEDEEYNLNVLYYYLDCVDRA